MYTDLNKNTVIPRKLDIYVNYSYVFVISSCPLLAEIILIDFNIFTAHAAWI